MHASAQADFAIVGLGRMGGNLARQAIEHGYRVAGFDAHAAPSDLLAQGLIKTNTIAELAASLQSPRIVFLYIPAGSGVDQLLEQLAPHLVAGDIVVDGGNSYWGDSVRRARHWHTQGIEFLDLGTSGGVAGARDGACFMAGGSASAVAAIEPILRKLSVPGGFVNAGASGNGHFTKLVHNGIEFGMLQAIGEGIALLRRYPQALPLTEVLSCWRHGSVIRSWLIDLLEAALRENPDISTVPPIVEDTGEVNWLVEDALRLEVPVPVIAQSVMQLLASRESSSDSARAVALMRHGFGGHPYGRDAHIAAERRDSRLGGFIDPAAAPP